MLPDLAPMLRDFYLADTPVSALVGDQVHLQRIDRTRSWPLLLVSMLPSQSITTAGVDRTVSALVQLEGFGVEDDDDGGAWDICATAHARARVALAAYDHPAGRVTGVRPATGPQPLPLDDHQKARCAATITVVAHPHPVSA